MNTETNPLQRAKTLRAQTITKFRASIPEPNYSVAHAAFSAMDELTVARTVLSLIEMAFTAAQFLGPGAKFDDNELLFALAALPHDTCLNERIAELAG